MIILVYSSLVYNLAKISNELELIIGFIYAACLNSGSAGDRRIQQNRFFQQENNLHYSRIANQMVNEVGQSNTLLPLNIGNVVQSDFHNFSMDHLLSLSRHQIGTFAQKKTNSTRIFLILVNILILCAYAYGFCHVSQKVSSSEDASAMSDEFFRFASTIIGVGSLIIGVTFLKYGSLLESNITHLLSLGHR